ncbi:DUF1826 domain-containing protein [Acetobacter malorum]|uniref:DUF1826 domain-containing protein n=1 Tax=Acetobacter malorum TaxID=178901 RepID=A0A1Y3GES5_9PROT|nr:DUF1826 domain-containing protein [Acetobacter malorum]OUJ07824.1 hypothetical protein HK23_00720 [Acetobacter malorum]
MPHTPLSFHHPTPDAAFQAIEQPACHIAVVDRILGQSLENAAQNYLEDGPALILTAGTPEELAHELAPVFTPATRALLEDALALADRYCAATRMDAVRFRLEQITHDSCRRFHVDHVVLRLLCTYVGPGVQWRQADLGEEAAVYQAEAGAVALLKGGCYPGWQPEGAVQHRSPPLSTLAKPITRLLLTLDAPQACGMSDNQRQIVQKEAMRAEA